jgi:hypothetical protein
MILSYYEAMSRLKINFEKSEVFIMGLSAEDQLLAANTLGCKIGVFPHEVFRNACELLQNH